MEITAANTSLTAMEKITALHTGPAAMEQKKATTRDMTLKKRATIRATTRVMALKKRATTRVMKMATNMEKITAVMTRDTTRATTRTMATVKITAMTRGMAMTRVMATEDYWMSSNRHL